MSGLCFVLLSPTFGMHQYTADLANRAADGRLPLRCAGDVTVITTAAAPLDRYAPRVRLVTPFAAQSTGFRREGLHLPAYRAVRSAILRQRPALVHFTGVHLWNLPLVCELRRLGIPVIHTLHDLDPHRGVPHARLIRVWNWLIITSGAHILVHGQIYRQRLLAQVKDPARVTSVPLLHGFWSWDVEPPPAHIQEAGARSVVLFFGRVEPYKGVDTLLDAWRRVGYNSVTPAGTYERQGGQPLPRLVIAGAVSPLVAASVENLPAGVELRPRRIDDAEALSLFGSASLLVLPYHDATQSALVAAAYAFGVPVIVTRTGALPEYVVPAGAAKDRQRAATGWIVPPADPAALAEALTTALQALSGDSGAVMRVATRAWYDEQRRSETATLAEMYDSRAAVPGEWDGRRPESQAAP